MATYLFLPISIVLHVKVGGHEFGAVVSRQVV